MFNEIPIFIFFLLINISLSFSDGSFRKKIHQNYEFPFPRQKNFFRLPNEFLFEKILFSAIESVLNKKSKKKNSF